MNYKILTLAALIIVPLSACATKRYPIATPLSAVESASLSCRELAIEEAKTDEVWAKIANTAGTDWRSAAGFLGDFGIGNAMAKSEAEESLAERKLTINAAQADKGCS